MKELKKPQLKYYHIIGGSEAKWQMPVLAYSELHACKWFIINFGWELSTITIV